MKFRFSVAIVFVGLVLLLATSGVFAQGSAPAAAAPEPAPKWRGSAEIKGTVKDATGLPLADAKVTVALSADTVFLLRTGPTGEFIAKGIVPGEWNVQVEATDFLVFRQTVQVAATDNPPIAAVMTRDTTRETLAKADALFTQGKNAEARAEYMAVLEMHPELKGINRGIALTYGREKNHPEALRYLDLALAGSPTDITLLLLAEASAMEIGDIRRGMAYLARIDDATLTDPEALLNCALDLLNRNRPAEATVLLNRVVTRFPAAAAAYFYRGYASLLSDKPANAKTDLEKYLSIAPPTAPLVAQAKDLLSKIR